MDPSQCMTRFDFMVIHHTGGPRSQTMDQIRQYHTAAPPIGRGWRDIGYHWVIEADGSSHIGRPLPTIGAHCQGSNSRAIGIALVGNNLDPEEEWLPVQIATARDLIAAIRLVFPRIVLRGHCELADPGHTICPGIDVAELFGR